MSDPSRTGGQRANSQGLLIILSGPSGTGKGTVAELLAKEPGIELSVSRTTRAPRSGETDGVHYFFTSKAEFEDLIAKNGFLEYAEYNGSLYGTPVANVKEKLAGGISVILEIEVKGAKKIMDTYKEDYISVFMISPAKKDIKKRLTERGTESAEVIGKRLAIADEEIKMADYYDYLVINDTVEKAVSDIKTIIAAERLRIPRNISFIKNWG